uniref:Uncharacterized protein n=1 Tax=Rhizophagus irregularis (strain DAOM 181602 / DAOM 197198 / MUCL 43194) TaxID=747089 RepID=U9TH06_RHIID
MSKIQIPQLIGKEGTEVTGVLFGKISNKQSPISSQSREKYLNNAGSKPDQSCFSSSERKISSGIKATSGALQFETGLDCIARLSRELTHPASKFSSEAAAMKYVAQKSTGGNTIGIVLRRIPQKPLIFHWNGCLDSIYIEFGTS